jgi:ribose/xylose/arabinose/galactoside ABC-type transport system permease subunit
MTAVAGNKISGTAGSWKGERYMNTKSAKLQNALKVIALPVLVYLLFFILSRGKFGKLDGIIINFKQTLAPTLISYALMCNMLCGRLDMSSGAVVMLSAMFGAKMVYLYGIGLVPFTILVVGTGIVTEIISGIAYRLLRVPAIVTSLGMCMVYETLANLASISWVTAINGKITTFGRFPYCLIVFGIMFVAMWIIYNHTKFGYNVRACASSQVIAKNAGVDTKKTAFLCYVVAAFFLGAAALLKISIQGSIDTPMYMSSTNLIFNSLLGIFVGVALQQYCNILIGIFIGNFVLNMLTTGLMNMGLSSSLQDTASGIFLLLIMIFTYNSQRILDFISNRKLHAELAKEYGKQS